MQTNTLFAMYNSLMRSSFDSLNEIKLSTKPPRPFMKWAGGKSQLIEKFAVLFPPELREGKIKKYLEPFIGGGAIFFYVAQAFPSIASFFISDVNEELILAYRTIQKDVDNLISLLDSIEREYHVLTPGDQKAF
jgi:DNA adenine methylase